MIAKSVQTLADSCSKLADVRWIVQIGIQMKCSPPLQHSVKPEFAEVLSLLKLILMTCTVSLPDVIYSSDLVYCIGPAPALEL